MTKMYLPKNVQYIISRLNNSGYTADVVGGCVRDFLLGKVPGDYDITTNATPNEMKYVFSGERIIETGIKHGTVTILIDGEPYEITTYRIDGKYTDNRRPDSVFFTRCLKEDLSRRDFTINAMCYNDSDGFVDIFGGLSDLEAKKIKAVGDPERRFSEDALRIMRAIRFASVLGFTVEEETSRAIHKLKGLLLNVAYERIFTEWKKLIGGIGAYDVILEYSDVLAEIIPELSNLTLPSKSEFENAEADARELSLFACSIDDKPESTYAFAMNRMRSDSNHKRIGVSVLEHLNDKTETEEELKLLLMKLGEESVRSLIKLRVLLEKTGRESLSNLNMIIKRGDAYRISDLKINGEDLSILGFKGKRIGEMLNALLLMVIRKEVKNEKESLISAVTKNM